MHAITSCRLSRVLVTFCLLVFSPQVFASPQYKTYVHAGFLDHKTGTSLVGYAHSVHQTSQNDFFLGVGTAVTIVTASAGWRRTFYDQWVQGYSVLALHAVTAMGGVFFAPFASLGAEKHLFGSVYLNVGVNATLRPGATSGVTAVTVPNVNLSMRY